MRNRIKFTILRIFVSIVLCIVLVSGGMAVTLAESHDPVVPRPVFASFLGKDIYIDGVHINNWELARPFLILDDICYAPVDSDRNIVAEPTGECVNDLNGMEVNIGYNEEIDGTIAEIRDVLICDNGDKYYSIRLLTRLGDIDADYSSLSGLYISTDGTDAGLYKKSNPNKSYIEGRCAYMMHVNSELEKTYAVELEYLMRHVASSTAGVSQDFLMAVAKAESRFHVRIGTKAAGLMQILVKYANQAGYDYDEITDPHTNLHYGAACLADGLKKFKNDKMLALSAYNLGTYRVLSSLESEEETLDLSYAAKVYGIESEMRSWIARNGYTNSFVEKIEIETGN